MLSFTNITLCFSNIFNNSNVSALDYSSNVGVGFTFNPTISINISSPDLVINDLTPGTTADSNNITISVATNTAYGYTLSATADGSDLIHTNETNTFSGIATDASLESLTMDNTWGYSYKNNTASSPTWSNYSGLATNINKVLFNTDNNTTSSIDFKIAAKASPTQPSGIYTGTINFYAITKPTPMNLAESYFAHGKTRYNGYYTMQDMTTEICNDTEVIGEGSQTELIDIRDNKVYWATKLADNHCWMTQNLDLDLDSNRTYTHWDTDLGWTVMDEEAEWRPERSTINFRGDTVPGWSANQVRPYSANPGDIYYYTSNSDADDIKYNSLQECISAGHNDCAHYHAGNYYNWSAAVANNDTSEMANGSAPNSICAKGWKLIDTNGNDFGILLFSQDIISSPQNSKYLADGFNSLRRNPVFLIRSGEINSQNKIADTDYGLYWSSNSLDTTYSKGVNFSTAGANHGRQYGRYNGLAIRCLAH